jgi:hypothetical protein
VCAEFVINNSLQESVKDTPFSLNYGMQPLTPVSANVPLVPSTHDFVKGIKGAVRRTKQELQVAQNCMAQRVNAHPRSLQFNPGDMTLPSTKKLRTARILWKFK